jgi:RNA polymerase sigma factor (TIGR02999 family)
LPKPRLPGHSTGAEPRSQEVTRLLVDWRDGDRDAFDRLVPLVYQELRQIARAHLRGERRNHTLQTTDVVNEVYLRLIDLHQVTLQDRRHFFAMSARLMRRILIDHARRKRAARRGGGATMVTLDGLVAAAERSVVDVIAVDQALDELSAVDERQCRLVELRVFAGLTIGESAEALGVSTATAERDWAMARAWLYQRLSTS